MTTPTSLPTISDFVDLIDQLNKHHAQASAVLGVLQLSLCSKGGEPTEEALTNTIWAVQDILAQAMAAISSLPRARPSGAA